jgi:hypothetical protein
VAWSIVSAGASVIRPVSWKADLAAVVLAALALVLWPPIRPAVFGAAFAVACPLWYTLLAGTARSGNLFGLALIVVAAAGAMVAVAAAGIGMALRRFHLPAWAPAVPLIAAVVVLVAAKATESSRADAQFSALVRFFDRLDAAERSYAAGPPARGFTCNGPDLPSITGIDWRTDYNLGGFDRNQGPYEGYWIVLRCEPAARPSFYSVTAMPTSGVGPMVTWDSRSGRMSIGRGTLH